MKSIAINAAYKAVAAAIVIASSSSTPANAQTRTATDQHHLMTGNMNTVAGMYSQTSKQDL